jgi:hypothetical protein
MTWPYQGFTHNQRAIVRALNEDCLALQTPSSPRAESLIKNNYTSAAVRRKSTKATKIKPETTTQPGLLEIFDDANMIDTHAPDQRASTLALLRAHAPCLDLIFNAFADPIPAPTKKELLKHAKLQRKQQQQRTGAKGRGGGVEGKTAHTNTHNPARRSIHLGGLYQGPLLGDEGRTRNSDSDQDDSEDSDDAGEAVNGGTQRSVVDDQECNKQDPQVQHNGGRRNESNTEGTLDHRQRPAGTLSSEMTREKQPVVNHFSTLRFTDFSQLIVRCGLLDSGDLKNKHVGMVFKAACARRKWCGPCDAPLSLRIDDFACALVHVGRIRFKANFNDNTTRQTALLLRDIIVPFTQHVLAGAGLRQRESISGSTLIVVHSRLCELQQTFDRVCVMNGDAQLPVVLSRDQFVDVMDRTGLLTLDARKRFADAGSLFDECTKYDSGAAAKGRTDKNTPTTSADCMGFPEFLEVMILLLGAVWESRGVNSSAETDLWKSRDRDSDAQSIGTRSGRMRALNTSQGNASETGEVGKVTEVAGTAEAVQTTSAEGALVDQLDGVRFQPYSTGSVKRSRDEAQRARLAHYIVNRFLNAFEELCPIV